MADNGENILVEFDYDNITLIDPNKLVDEQGNVSDRLVKQEDLVFYANLECNVLPRTKLAVGTAINDQQRTISVGKINFLNPGHKTFMDTAWSDELTGKDSLQGKGVNQVNLTSVKNPNKSDDYYITQNLLSNGTPGAVDNGLLGIKSIKVDLGLDFLPVISVQLEDVKGRALFEGGNNSPYSAFFQLPYPQFTLTLKGYYGKAIKFPIMLQSFTSRFDPSSHNFIIDLRFYGYKYTLLSYINFGSLMAVPHMYNNKVTQLPNSITQGNNVDETSVSSPKIVSRGYQKMKEVYSIYKSKGLIDDDFPELTVNQLKYRLQTFIDEVLNNFAKENLGVLTTMSEYLNNLIEYQKRVFGGSSSWFNKYMDIKNPIILNNQKNVYFFKKELSLEKREFAKTELNGIILDFNKRLNENAVFGEGGSYTVGTITERTQIPINISEKTLILSDITIDDINLKESFISQQNGLQIELSPENTPVENLTKNDLIYISYVKDLQTELKTGESLFLFEGKDSFMELTNLYNQKSIEFRSKIEKQITDNLAEKFNNRGNGGLGFVPSIRNILAIFFCQGEAFLRLMDEVHKKAWDQRENPYRRAAIFGNSTTAPSVDVKSSTEDNEPVYPWPQVIKESVGNDNEEKFELIYPGAQNVSSTYRSYNSEIWPEIEFVEQFIKGYTQRITDNTDDFITSDSDLNPLRISLNAIEFPVSNEVLQNKDESKFFYEIYERLILNSYYSKLNRKSGYDLGVYEIEGDNESTNILKSLSNDNPFLIKKIKEYLLDGTNYLSFLRHISNQGQGENWQNFIRGTFVTPYIKNDVENPNVIYNVDILDNPKSQPNVSLSNVKNINNIEKYLTETSSSNNFDFTDVYPITNLEWDRLNLANGKSLNNSTEAFDTKNVLEYNDTHKTITNFENGESNNVKRPFTHFNFRQIETLTVNNLKEFYNNRKLTDQFVTEGNLKYFNYSNNLTENQTTSMLNTPYFINSIQEGVFNFRYKQNDKYPFKNAAYLFLNSLPLGTLREKYKTSNGESTTDLNYILSSLKKFGGVHKLPYSWILKYGSIWHRFKEYKKTNTDMLDGVWDNFNYVKNWDPVTSATTKTYNLTIDGLQRDLVLDSTTGTQPFTNITTGFYPQLVDDFNVFLQGLKVFSGKTQVNGQCEILNISGDINVVNVSGTAIPLGNTIDITEINENYINIGDTITFPSSNVTVTIGGQISGENGGVGVYTILPSVTSQNQPLEFVLGTYGQITNLNETLFNGANIIGELITSPITIGTQISGELGSNGVYKINNTVNLTSSFLVSNPPLQVVSISNNVLSNGSVINGLNLNGNITILNQISGTTGGEGLYVISPNQTPATSVFVVDGVFINGLTSSEIQSNIDSGKLILLNTTNSNIYEPIGFDPNNSLRTMRVTPWSVVIRSELDNESYYVLPSFGSNINQTKDEAFNNGVMKVEISNNSSMYNGSVRLFWNTPQYGWFDNSKVIKNSPEKYLKQILNEQKDQQNFLIGGDENDYTSFEELFTTFNSKTLDLFESEFLNFSRSIYDYVDTLPERNTQRNILFNNESEGGGSELVSDKAFKNFQYLMRLLLKVDRPIGDSPETKLENIISSQNSVFQKLLTSFMNYDVVLKIGNPSEFNRRLFTTFSTRFIEDPIRYRPYVQGSLPTQGGGITLQQSKQSYPSAWLALETYVGKSTIPQLVYSNNGSYITDFFVDLKVEFTEKNVIDFAPIIKIYATQKLKNPNLNVISFYGLMDEYLNDSEEYINNVINVMLPTVRKELPNIVVTDVDDSGRADLEAGFTEQTRLELWETFKALNDTWIAGYDFENKTLFEDVMLVDRASRDVGDKVIVDIFKIMDIIDGYSYKQQLLDIVTTILVQNNFQHFMLPSYVNFYNVQDAQKNPTPRPDGSLDFGNSLFGTFLNVDYRQSSPKFLCYYVNKPSEHLNMKDNIDYRYRDDAFDLRRASDNPLVESQVDKTDWARSNKIVGFNVDITRPNQQVFKSFSVNQDPGKPTSESLEMLNEMANLSKNRRSTTQSVSLYNLYKNRSYSCSVDMMGNALIQPMMYFNLRNVPMFSGPYMITKISHDITENGFETHFDGIRQPFYSLPKIDNFIQTLNIKLLSTLDEKIQERERKERNNTNNIIFQRDNILSNIKAEEELTNSQSCQDKLNPRYFRYTGVDIPTRTDQTIKELFDNIVEVMKDNNVGNVNSTEFKIIALVMFTFIYVDSGTANKISAYENNYSTINLKEVYGDSFTNYINRSFFCVTRGSNTNIPIASFKTFKDFLTFVLNRVINLLSKIRQVYVQSNGDNSIIQILSKLYILDFPIVQPENVYTSMTEQDINLVENEFKKAIDIYKTVQTFDI